MLNKATVGGFSIFFLMITFFFFEKRAKKHWGTFLFLRWSPICSLGWPRTHLLLPQLHKYRAHGHLEYP